MPTREEILDRLTKITLETVPELGKTRLDPDRPSAELGISSVNLAAIMTKLTAELGVKVPASEMLDAVTPGELVDLMVRKVAEKG